MKVVGYTRVSLEEMANTGCSLQAQAAKIAAYTAAFGHELVEIVEDAGISGMSMKRPGIQKALEMLRNREADALLVAKLDRLSRSLVDQDTLVRIYFSDTSKFNSVLLAVDQEVNTRTAAGRTVLNILMSLAQGERETISERTRAALAHLKSQGVKLGRPVGTRVAVDDPAMVARIQELHAQKLSLRKIAEALTSEGVATKTGAAWQAETIRKIIARNAQKEAA